MDVVQKEADAFFPLHAGVGRQEYKQEAPERLASLDLAEHKKKSGTDDNDHEERQKKEKTKKRKSNKEWKKDISDILDEKAKTKNHKNKARTKFCRAR